MGALIRMSSHDAYQTADDSQLVSATLEGHAEAFEVLVERYQRRLFGLVRNYTRNAAEVEDIVQDTFLKAFSRLETFQQSSAFYTWLYRIGVNTILDVMKRRGRNPVTAVEDPELVGRTGTGASDATQERLSIRPDARLEREEVGEITRSVMDELPEIFRTVLVMRELEQMAYQDIADTLEISIGTVESRLFRARARFKQKLLQLHPEFAAGQEAEARESTRADRQRRNSAKQADQKGARKAKP
ncbi:ECF RNA polymerase sigma-E factor [Planctomycetes bacterium Poly30]|uniref:RNA polymerase sigma factor n=2 Tax=Saltatorellus ferox TaxID=2528018 RepID=A0A518ELW9_9BACT|nr:ECF RNA polymerase sigma-E factor [Planctomycetes bacterium Poly30]